MVHGHCCNGLLYIQRVRLDLTQVRERRKRTIRVKPLAESARRIYIFFTPFSTLLTLHFLYARARVHYLVDLCIAAKVFFLRYGLT